MHRTLPLIIVSAALGGVGCGDEVTVVHHGANTAPGVGTATGAETSTSTSTASGTSTSTSTSTGAHGCWAGSEKDCWECCSEEHYLEGYVLDEIYLAQCLCGADTPCYAECSDVVCEGRGLR